MGIISGGGGGGFAPVSVVLQAQGVNVHAVAAHDMKWDRALDNLWDANAITSLPTGIGVTAAIDGSDATITTTVRGTWSFAYSLLVISGDATYSGIFNDGLGIVNDLELVGHATQSLQFAASAVVSLPAAAAFPASVTTLVSAAAGQTVTAQLCMTRLA